MQVLIEYRAEVSCLAASQGSKLLTAGRMLASALRCLHIQISGNQLLVLENLELLVEDTGPTEDATYTRITA